MSGVTVCPSQLLVETNSDRDHGQSAVQALLDMHTGTHTFRVGVMDTVGDPEDGEMSLKAFNRTSSEYRREVEQSSHKPENNNMHAMMDRLREQSLHHATSHFVMSDQSKLTLTVARVGAVLAVLDTAAAIVLNELVYMNGNEDDIVCECLKIFSWLLSLALCACVFIHYRNKCFVKSRVFKTFWGTMARDWLICLLNVPPGVDRVVEIEALGIVTPYHIDNLQFVFSLVRWMFIFRWLYANSLANQYPKAKMLARLGDVKTKSMLFVYKEFMHHNAFRTLSTIFVLNVFVLAYLHRLAERSLVHPDLDYSSSTATDYFWNSMWFIIVTMFTVGYGDMYPTTHLGRFVAILAMLNAMVLTSMLVAIVAERTTETTQESRIIRTVDVESAHSKLRNAASRILALVWRAYVQRKASNGHGLQAGHRSTPSKLTVIDARLMTNTIADLKMEKASVIFRRERKKVRAYQLESRMQILTAPEKLATSMAEIVQSVRTLKLMQVDQAHQMAELRAMMLGQGPWGRGHDGGDITADPREGLIENPEAEQPPSPPRWSFL